MLNRLDRWLSRVENLLSHLASLACLAMMVVIVADVGGRFFFNRPIMGVLTLTEMYLMVAVVFLALPKTQRTGGHLRVDVFSSRFPPGFARWVEVVWLAAALVVLGLMAHTTGTVAWDTWRAGRVVAGPIPWPRGPALMLVAVGVSGLWLRLALRFLMTLSAMLGRAPAAEPVGEEPAP